MSQFAWHLTAAASMDSQVCQQVPPCHCCTSSGSASLPLVQTHWGPFGSVETATADARASGWDANQFVIKELKGSHPPDDKAPEAAITRYVLGLAFDAANNLLLIHKKRGPAAVVGRLNGLGGKAEPGETYSQAMVREFEEECGLTTAENTWWFVATLKGPDWTVVVLATRTGLNAARTTTDEHLAINPADDLQDVVPNLRWLTPLALQVLNGQNDADVEARYD